MRFAMRIRPSASIRLGGVVALVSACARAATPSVVPTAAPPFQAPYEQPFRASPLPEGSGRSITPHWSIGGCGLIYVEPPGRMLALVAENNSHERVEATKRGCEEPAFKQQVYVPGEAEWRALMPGWIRNRRREVLASLREFLPTFEVGRLTDIVELPPPERKRGEPPKDVRVSRGIEGLCYVEDHRYALVLFGDVLGIEGPRAVGLPAAPAWNRCVPPFARDRRPEIVAAIERKLAEQHDDLTIRSTSECP